MINERISPLLGRDDVYVIATRDGSNTLFSREYSATYHSIYGAVSESKHTYIQKCLLNQLDRNEINILEFGFGTGLNAFLAFHTAETYQKQINYTGFEAYPLDLNIISQLDYPGYLAYSEKQAIFMKMHETNAFTENYFQFRRMDHWDILKMAGPFDCIFFDAFAPEIQPDLWGQEMFDLLYNLTSDGGCLVTYCAKGDVRRRLAHTGFDVKRIPGAPGKRQMLQAFKFI